MHGGAYTWSSAALSTSLQMASSLTKLASNLSIRQKRSLTRSSRSRNPRKPSLPPAFRTGTDEVARIREEVEAASI